MHEEDETRAKKKRTGNKKRRLAICLTNCQFDAVREAAKSLGIREVSESRLWDIFWTDLSVSLERAKNMKGFQRINHFPGMTEICRKDLLARNLLKMRKVFPEEYNFFPNTWILPADYGNLSANYAKKKSKIFILKPVLSSQGRGIILSVGVKDLCTYERMICQRYITKPFLLDGYKFDLRIYTLVTSCDPLRIFVYNEGLVRFATKKYAKPSVHNISNVYMHLTNYAVNKYSQTYNKDGEYGSKRKISTLNSWLCNHGYNVIELWNKIDDVIVKTFLSVYQTLQHNYTACFSTHSMHQACFELLGFDILLDQKLQPFLLEVNHSPSFSTKTAIDMEVKTNLLKDTFDILNISTLDKINVLKENKLRCKARLIQGINNKYDKCVESARKEQRLRDQEKWELEHMGNFRLIYPSKHSSKYDKIVDENMPFIQTTIASRSRDEATRQSRTEFQEKVFNENGRDLKTKDNIESKEMSLTIHKIPEKSQAMPSGKSQSLPLPIPKAIEEKPNPRINQDKPKARVSQEKKYVLNSFEPQPMETELEMKARLIMLQRKDLMVRRTGLPSRIYYSLRDHDLLTHSDKIKYGHLNKCNSKESLK